MSTYEAKITDGQQKLLNGILNDITRLENLKATIIHTILLGALSEEDTKRALLQGEMSIKDNVISIIARD